MHRIIISDIFGKTPALQEISDSLPGTSEIFDPYDEKFMNFMNEEEAYHFLRRQAMERRVSIGSVANALIDSQEILG